MSQRIKENHLCPLHTHSTAIMNLLQSRLFALVKHGQWNQNDVVDLFRALAQQYTAMETMKEPELIVRMSKTLYQIEIHKIKKSDLMSETEPGQFGENIENKVKTILKEAREKTLEEILEEIRAQRSVDENILADVKDIVSSVFSWCSSNPPAIPNSNLSGTRCKDLKNTLFNLCKAVHTKTKKWYPRLTQMVSWCILVLSGSSRLVQVGTGEGKSCIVAMFAAYCAITGQNVDIISSSPVLAERDAEEWHPFYQELSISVDFNTSEIEDRDLRECYKCQVVYGTTQSFAGDWLRQNFHRKKVRENEQNIQCVIVDEVDSLMLDKGLEVVYLNSPMPAMQALNIILAEIWFVVSQLQRLDTGKTLGLLQPFSQLLSENLEPDTGLDEFSILQMAEDSALTPTGSTKRIRENAQNILQQLKGVSIDQLVAFFNVFKELFPQYKFQLYHQEEDGTLQELNEIGGTDARNGQEVHILVLGSGFCRLVFMSEEELYKSLEKKMKAGFLSGVTAQVNESCIPGVLEFINDKLRTWIENAILAKKMTLGHEYILHKDGVVPVDYCSTGVVQNNMKWGEGLQQFLEMKHQTRQTDMCIVTNFRSNVGLFKSYKHIYGVTGTLGNQTELEMLQSLYPGIKVCKIPSFKQRKLHEEEGVVINDEKQWVKRICAAVEKQVSPTDYRGPRAALIICETINRAETLYRALGQKNSRQKLKLYTNNNMDNSEVIDKTVMTGDVIIATNLAGRGTDLKVCTEVNEAGGLFVVQTFLPLNIRVEQQAFGRTARQGSPGSAQLIMCSAHLSESLKLVRVLKTSPLSLLLSCLDRFTSSIISESIENEFAHAFKAYQDNPNNQNSEAMACALRRLLTIQKSIGSTILEEAKEARDTLVQIRLSRFLEQDIPNILKKEELFSVYLGMVDTIYKQDKWAKNREDIVSSLHECWGIWLLMRFNEDEDTETLKQQLNNDLQRALEKLQSKRSPSSMVYHYIRSGNRLRHQGLLTESIEMYTRATEDPCWVAIALYNHALCILAKKESGYIAQALTDLEKAEKEVESYMKQLELTFSYVKMSSNGLNIDDSLLGKQFQAKFLIQKLLKLNIQEAVNRLQVAHNRGDDVQVTEKLVIFLVPVPYLLSQGSVVELTRELINLSSLGLDTIVSVDVRFSFAGFLTKIFRSVR